MTIPSLPLLSPPKQRRSRETLEALLRAAEAQLETKSFADVTVSSIVKAAGSSSGSFYARFADKNVLLHALHARFAEQFVSHVQELVSELHGRRLPLDEFSVFLVDAIVPVRTQQRGLIRAVLIASLNDPGFGPRATALLLEHSKLFASVLDAPKVSRKRLLSEVGLGLLAAIAILDQALFIGPAAARRTKRQLDRMARVVAASMDLGS